MGLMFEPWVLIGEFIENGWDKISKLGKVSFLKKLTDGSEASRFFPHYKLVNRDDEVAFMMYMIKDDIYISLSEINDIKISNEIEDSFIKIKAKDMNLNNIEEFDIELSEKIYDFIKDKIVKIEDKTDDEVRLDILNFLESHIGTLEKFSSIPDPLEIIENVEGILNDGTVVFEKPIYEISNKKNIYEISNQNVLYSDGNLSYIIYLEYDSFDRVSGLYITSFKMKEQVREHISLNSKSKVYRYGKHLIGEYSLGEEFRGDDHFLIDVYLKNGDHGILITKFRKGKLDNIVELKYDSFKERLLPVTITNINKKEISSLKEADDYREKCGDSSGLVWASKYEVYKLRKKIMKKNIVEKLRKNKTTVHPNDIECSRLYEFIKGKSPIRTHDYELKIFSNKLIEIVVDGKCVGLIRKDRFDFYKEKTENPEIDLSSPFSLAKTKVEGVINSDT